jgi:hypothetical protein
MGGILIMTVANFIKPFDDSYWLSREESILSYLVQREAPVPKVQFKDTIKKELALENIGSSLNLLFKSTDGQSPDALCVLSLTLKTIKALNLIFNLGILHVDIALRNVGANNLQADKVYILDFSHSISKHNILQKPLNLIPTQRLHHPELYDALRIDWLNYCSFFNIKDPKIDLNFEVSNKDFSSYWPSSVEVQNLVSRKCILCHGIGNLLQEVIFLLPPHHQLHILFADTSSQLMNLNESDADHFLLQTIQVFEKELNFLEIRAAQKTPIPKKQKEVSPTSTPQEKTTPELILTSSSDKKPVVLTLAPSKRVPNSMRPTQALTEFIPWCMVLLNAVWINLIIDVGKVQLHGGWIQGIILVTSLAFFTTLFSVFVKKPNRQSCRLIALVLIGLLELSLVSIYPNAIMSHFWLWLPSSIVILFICIYFAIKLGRTFLSIDK